MYTSVVILQHDTMQCSPHKIQDMVGGRGLGGAYDHIKVHCTHRCNTVMAVFPLPVFVENTRIEIVHHQTPCLDFVLGESPGHMHHVLLYMYTLLKAC